MIYVTGDTHGDIDILKINTQMFPLQRALTRNDYLIVAGDFGAVWDGDRTDKYLQNQWGMRNFTTLFVDGNHENHDLLSSYPVTEWHGGRVHMISESIIHLMRGEVYDIDGCRILTLGGAQSHDMWCRKEGKSWWKGELPTTEELYNMLDTIEAHVNDIDYVITHEAPDHIQDMIDLYNEYDHDRLSNFLEAIYDIIPFKRWYCGHYHVDVDIAEKNVDKTCSILYNRVVELETGRQVNKLTPKPPRTNI